MSDSTKLLLIILVFLVILVFGVPLLFMLTETRVGDVLTTNQLTPLYSSYTPGKLGEVLCVLPEGTDVTIREILTGNDLPGYEKTMITGIKAFLVETINCNGWLLPDYIK